MKFEIYKAGQGKYTRIITLLSVIVIAMVGAVVLSEKLAGYVSALLAYGIPTVVVLGVGALMLWIVNRPAAADFLIATEGEMKKVSWSSRKEIIGSTKVVIVTALIMSLALFAVDILFVLLFKTLKVF